MSQIVTVIGATGHIGQPLVNLLLKGSITVRAVGQNQSKLAPLAKQGARAR